MTTLPATAIVVKTAVDVTTAYSPGSTIMVGNATTPNLLADAGVANIQVANPAGQPYSTGDTDIAFAGGTATVTATVTGGPAAGACEVLVFYVLTPNP